MEECVYCEGVADFVMIDGGWYVCAGCIKEGQTDTEGINYEPKHLSNL
jgi:hypothetical protein